MISQAQFIETVRSYVGVRFKHQGRTRAGLDCWGLVVAACRDLGIAVADNGSYGHSPDESLVFSTIEQTMKAKPVAEMCDGDVIVLRMIDNKRNHIAIASSYDGRRTIISSEAMVRKVCERGLDPNTARTIAAVYAIPEVTNG